MRRREGENRRETAAGIWQEGGRGVIRPAVLPVSRIAAYAVKENAPLHRAEENSASCLIRGHTRIERGGENSHPHCREGPVKM